MHVMLTYNCIYNVTLCIYNVKLFELKVTNCYISHGPAGLTVFLLVGVVAIFL